MSQSILFQDVTTQTVAIDSQQLKTIVDALQTSFWSPEVIISLITLLAAVAAVALTALIYLRQRIHERRLLTMSLHSEWWSPEMGRFRYVVSEQMNIWRSEKQDSPAMRYYSRAGMGWGDDSEERRAHTRVLYFFCDLNTMMNKRLLDDDMALELLGLHHFRWFEDYFKAIVAAAAARPLQPGEFRPRFVEEIPQLTGRLEHWCENERRRGRSNLNF